MQLFLTSKSFNGLQEILPDKPKNLIVGFVPTAANVAHRDGRPWIHDDEVILREMGFRVKLVDIDRNTKSELVKVFDDIHLIYVAGGNTFYLLQEARKSGFDCLIKGAVEQGVLYVGASAGAVLVGPTIEPVRFIDDPAEAPELTDYTGLSLTDFLVVPHYNNEASYQRIMQEYGKSENLLLLPDDQSVIVRDRCIRVLSEGK